MRRMLTALAVLVALAVLLAACTAQPSQPASQTRPAGSQLVWDQTDIYYPAPCLVTEGGTDSAVGLYAQNHLCQQPRRLLVRDYGGNPCLLDGQVYCTTTAGQLITLAADGTGRQTLAENVVYANTADGRVYYIAQTNAGLQLAAYDPQQASHTALQVSQGGFDAPAVWFVTVNNGQRYVYSQQTVWQLDDTALTPVLHAGDLGFAAFLYMDPTGRVYGRTDQGLTSCLLEGEDPAPLDIPLQQPSDGTIGNLIFTDTQLYFDRVDGNGYVQLYVCNLATQAVSKRGNAFGGLVGACGPYLFAAEGVDQALQLFYISNGENTIFDGRANLD